MALARSLAGSLVKPLAAAIAGGGADLAADVRALFTANGGDFTGTMLDFGKTDALWQDTGATTPAGDGDTLARVDDQSGEGNNATQSSAGSRPTLTTDPFGTLVAQPDGTDDFMNLPDGVLGDGTQHVHVFAAYALDNANSDAGSRVIIGGNAAYGISVQHQSTLGYANVFVQDGGGAGSNSTAYDRALTDNESIVRAVAIDPAGDVYQRVNGAEVSRVTHGYSSLDDPGAPTLFGTDTTESLAGTCHGIVILTGSRAMTATEIATVEAYLADLASDTLLTADADTVLSRVFRPATDLNYQSDFSTLDGWAEASASVTVSGGKLVVAGSGGNARARRRFPVRVGYAYTFSAENDGPDILQYDIDTSGFTGGGDVVNTTVSSGASDVRTIVATSPFLYVQLTTSSGDSANVPDYSVTEIAATGDYWDLLDPTKRFTDAGSTQAGANDDVQQINSVEGNYAFTQTTSADQATLDGTATNLVFDGSTDFYVATDATDDLVQTGDTTELWAVTPDVSASARVISSAGDSTVATDTASVFSINGSDQLSLQQADASNTETETTAITVTEGAVNVISFVRDGASVVFGIGADEVETETFATVTTPTAGTSPAFNLGISVDQSSGPYDGSIQAGLKLDRALSTGLTVHAIRALQEKTA